LTGAKQGTKAINWSSSPSAAIWSNWQTNFTSNSWGTAGNLPLYDYLRDEPDAGGFTFINANGPVRHAYTTPSIQELVTTDIASATANSSLNNIDIMVPTVGAMDPIGGSLQRSTYNTWLSGNANNCGNGSQPCGTRLLWHYQACNSFGTCTNGVTGAGSPYPAYAIDATAATNRVMEWLSYLQNISGEIYYAAMICGDLNSTGALCGYPTHPNDPWISVYYSGGWGDGTMLYTGSALAGTNYMGTGVTKPIVLPSLRLKLIRNGIQDYEYMNVLNANGKGSYVTMQINNWITNSYTFDPTATGLNIARINLGAQMQLLTFPTGSLVPAGVTLTGATVQ
jgi:hypothetical protein